MVGSCSTPLIYVSRTEIWCTSPQCGHLTFNVANITREDRRQLEAIVSDRSAPQKHVWRANIILATADGCGTAEIMRRSGKSKPLVWTWQARLTVRAISPSMTGFLFKRRELRSTQLRGRLQHPMPTQRLGTTSLAAWLNRRGAWDV